VKFWTEDNPVEGQDCGYCDFKIVRAAQQDDYERENLSTVRPCD
jgi:hypothetical protein